MRMDTIVVPLLAAVLTAAVMSAARYFSEASNHAEAADSTETVWETLKPAGRGNDDRTAGTSPARSDLPIKCYDPDFGEFWTNAASCEGADLNNRISESRVRPEIAVRQGYDDQRYEHPEITAKNESGGKSE